LSRLSNQTCQALVNLDELSSASRPLSNADYLGRVWVASAVHSLAQKDAGEVLFAARQHGNATRQLGVNERGLIRNFLLIETNRTLGNGAACGAEARDQAAFDQRLHHAGAAG
jgi:hypothetical protein